MFHSCHSANNLSGVVVDTEVGRRTEVSKVATFSVVRSRTFSVIVSKLSEKRKAISRQ